MKLIICEKPAQARDIARNLKANQRKEGYLEGNHYIVTWCIGHLLELAPPEYYKSDIKPWHIDKLPLIPREWKLLVSSRTKKQFNIIKQLLKKTQHVIIASDPDREGESIVREILATCHYQGKIERLWLSALDDASIQKALHAILPGSETEPLYFAAQARACSDYLIGMNLTMAASSLYGVNSVLSIGRVQTPTLKLVVDQDRSIETFTPQDYFVLRACFNDPNNASFWTIWKSPETFLDKQGHCLNRDTVETVAATIEDEPGIIQDFQETQKYQKPPLCFSLSALQKKASSLFGYSAKQVLDIAQALYEKHKATTYPRTDCAYLPLDQLKEAPQVIQALLTIDPSLAMLSSYCDTDYQSLVWNDHKITAHHAIIPTMHTRVNINKMSHSERQVYDLIRRYYLAQFMGDYEYQQRFVNVLCAGEIFVATANTPIKPGWKQALIDKKSSDDTDDKTEANPLPYVNKNDRVYYQSSKIESKQTQPPTHFTEGTLIDTMKTIGKSIDDTKLKNILKEHQGIGTEATRANIIEVLLKRDYIERKAKKILSTEKGRALIDLVPNIVKDPLLTAQWEYQLEQVALGKKNREEFIQDQTRLLKTMLAELKNEATHQRATTLQLQSETQNNHVYLCPHCNAALRRLKSKSQKVFWGCTQYPKCHFTTWEKNEKPHI